MAIATWTSSSASTDRSRCVSSFQLPLPLPLPSSSPSPVSPSVSSCSSPAAPPSPSLCVSFSSPYSVVSGVKASTMSAGFSRYPGYREPKQQQQQQQQQQQRQQAARLSQQQQHQHQHQHQHQQQQQRQRVSPPRQSPSSTSPSQQSASPGTCLSTTVKPALVGRFACEFVHRSWPGNTNVAATDATATAATPVHSSFVAFVSRVVRTSGISSAIIFLALLYVMRAGKMSPITTTTTTTTTAATIAGSSSRHPSPSALAQARLFTAAIILAQKITDDNRYTNKTWSELSGFSLLDVNRMEAELLARIGFSLHVTAMEFAQWVRQCAMLAAFVGVDFGASSSPKTTCRQRQHSGGVIPLPMLPTAGACQQPPPQPPLPPPSSSLQPQLLPAYYRKRKTPPYDRADRHAPHCNKIPRNDQHQHHHQQQQHHHNHHPAAYDPYVVSAAAASALPQQIYHLVHHQPIHQHQQQQQHPHHPPPVYPQQFPPVLASHNAGYAPPPPPPLAQQQHQPVSIPTQPVSSFGYYHPHFATMPRPRVGIVPAPAASAVGPAASAVGYVNVRRASYAQS
ncbi:hypothetical protein HDU89_002973 [Geranomyces variabilis]|nr:hypothetical protein HDU89_002973 [Geranomyces variabilis]